MSNVRIFNPEFAAQAKRPGFPVRVTMVAGGAGFIGSNLCRRLLEDDQYVICVDNFDTGRIENISDLLSDPRFRLFRHDIVEPFDIKGPVTRIYNLACPASPPKYQKDPVHTLKTSIVGAINLLDLAERTGARVLQSSTSEVYGDPDVSPQNELYRGPVNTVGPRSCYDEGKRAAETLFHDTFLTKGVDVRIARIFNTYGPQMDPEDGRVISNFSVQALLGQPLTIYGDGSQTRSFCYIDDMLDGLVALMETDTAGAEPVNLGNPGEFTIKDLAEKVLRMTQSSAGISYHDLPVDDPRQRRPDITRAAKLLGWTPKITLREGLVPTIDYFQQEIALKQGFKGGAE